MMTVRPSKSNLAYSSSGFTHRATLLGSVHGVVVQAYSHVFSVPFTLKRTNADFSLTVL